MSVYALTAAEIWILFALAGGVGIAIGLAIASIYVWATRPREPRPDPYDDPWS